MNYTIYVGNSTANCTTILTNESNVANGTYFYDYYSAINYATYYWRVQANDGTYQTNETFLFTVATTEITGGMSSAIFLIGLFAIPFAMLALTKRRKK